MRLARTCTVVLTALLLWSPSGAGAAETAPACTSMTPSPMTAPLEDVAAAAGPNPLAKDTSIHWTRWSRRVVHGDAAVLEGQVVTDDGALAAVDVELYERAAGRSGWTSAGSATADPDTGVFSFGCLEPPATTEYRVVYEGSLLHGASEAVREVAVSRRVPDRMRKVAPERFALTGAVSPRYAGKQVLLQRRSCAECRWRSVQTAETTRRSRWRFTVDASSFTGRRWFRVVVPADRRFVRSYGDHVWWIR